MEKTYRERTKGPSPTTCYYSYVYKGVTYSPALQTKSSESWTMSDYIDPGFSKRRSLGEVFNNSCNLNVVKRNHSTEIGEFSYWWTVAPADKYVMTSGNATDRLLSLAAPAGWQTCDASSSGNASAAALSKQKCLGHVDSTPYEFFEDLMEIGETIRFLQSPLRGIADLAHAFKNKRDRIMLGKPDDSKAKALANLWNQYQFAFRPLVHSVMSAAEALLNFDRLKRPTRRTAHGFGEDRTTASSQPTAWNGDQEYSYQKSSWRSYLAHSTIYYEVSNPLIDWAFALGLRKKDWPKAIWEFMPLSFMVDRLFDLKSMISGLTNLADPSVSFLASSCTVKHHTIVHLQAYAARHRYGTLGYAFGVKDKVYLDNFTYNRTIWTPGVGDVIPQFTPENFVKDVRSLVDLIAVIISRL